MILECGNDGFQSVYGVRETLNWWLRLEALENSDAAF